MRFKPFSFYRMISKNPFQKEKFTTGTQRVQGKNRTRKATPFGAKFDQACPGSLFQRYPR